MRSGEENAEPLSADEFDTILFDDVVRGRTDALELVANGPR